MRDFWLKKVCLVLLVLTSVSCVSVSVLNHATRLYLARLNPSIVASFAVYKKDTSDVLNGYLMQCVL